MFERWSILFTYLRPWHGLKYLVAIALSVPIVVDNSAGSPPVSWYDFQSFMSSIDNCLRLIFVVLLALLARHLGAADGPTNALGNLGQIRSLAIVLAVLGLLTPTVSVGGIPIAFLVGWLLIEVWLLPKALASPDRPLIGLVQTAAAQAAVMDLLRRTLTGRVRATLERDLTKKLVDGAEGTQDEAIARTVTLGLDRNFRSRALSTYGGRTPWQRGREFATAGLVIGLPWTVLDVAAALRTVTGGGPFRLLDAAATALVLLRFGLAGLTLGVAYPLVRGATGLAKGFVLFVTLAAPGLCITVLPDPHADGAWLAAFVQAAQWLSFGIVLGLFGDWQMLRQAGLGWRHLRELHRLTAVTAGVSTALVATLTAGTTAIGTGAANLFVERVLTPPPSPAAPPPSPTAPATPGASAATTPVK